MMKELFDKYQDDDIDIVVKFKKLKKEFEKRRGPFMG